MIPLAEALCECVAIDLEIRTYDGEGTNLHETVGQAPVPDGELAQTNGVVAETGHLHPYRRALGVIFTPLAMEVIARIDEDQIGCRDALTVDEGGPPGQPTLLAVSPAGQDLGSKTAL